jgi:hypothetical protein
VLDSVPVDALDRWGHTPRRWRLTATAEATVLVDRDRLGIALDALLENAIAHTAADCSRTPSRTPRRTTSSSSAPAGRTGM